MLFTPIMFALIPVFITLLFSRKAAVYMLIAFGVLAGWMLSAAFGLILAFMSGSADEIRTFTIDVTMTMQFLEPLTVDTMYQVFLAPYIFIADVIVWIMRLNFHVKSFILIFPQVLFGVAAFNFLKQMR